MSTPREREGSWYLISDTEDCGHEPIVRLGADNGNNEYYQCEACETVLIKEGYVDHREVRQQRQEQNQGSDNPLANALGVDSLTGPRDRRTRSPSRSRSSSTIVTRIRKISRRLLGR